MQPPYELNLVYGSSSRRRRRRRTLSSSAPALWLAAAPPKIEPLKPASMLEPTPSRASQASDPICRRRSETAPWEIPFPCEPLNKAVRENGDLHTISYGPPIEKSVVFTYTCFIFLIFIFLCFDSSEQVIEKASKQMIESYPFL
jgi:hypothetical protein